MNPKRSTNAKTPTGLARIAALVAVLFSVSGASHATEAGRDFGAGVTLERATQLSEVVAEPQRFAEQTILLDGHLTDLCMKKGCWTVLTQGDQFVRVRFEDYGFFLPPDALGKRALVQGKAELRTLSQREARHLASESRGGDPDAIVGPQRELGFVATGVRVLSAN